jgi:hypothetical protein
MCQDVLTDPVALLCCRSHACQRCLAALSHCPSCAHPLPSPPRVVDTALSTLCKQHRNRNQGLRQCLVCLDKSCSALHGLFCHRPDSGTDSTQHFVCGDCFEPLVRSVCEDGGKLRDARFAIVCPVPQCRRPWSTSEVTRLLLAGHHKDTLDLYVSTLTAAAERANSSAGSSSSSSSLSGPVGEGISAAVVRRLLAEALSLRCPSPLCAAVLDQRPDGCCAMRCVHCGVFFCWLCFQLQATNQACHDHVRFCARNPVANTLFLSEPHQRATLRLLRLEKIHKSLAGSYSNGWRDNRLLVQTLRDCDDVLSETEITVNHILSLQPPFNANNINNNNNAQQQPRHWWLPLHFEYQYNHHRPFLDVAPANRTIAAIIVLALVSGMLAYHLVVLIAAARVWLWPQFAVRLKKSMRPTPQPIDLLYWHAFYYLVITPALVFALKKLVWMPLQRFVVAETAVKVVLVAWFISTLPVTVCYAIWYAIRLFYLNWLSLLGIALLTRDVSLIALYGALFTVFEYLLTGESLSVVVPLPASVMAMLCTAVLSLTLRQYIPRLPVHWLTVRMQWNVDVQRQFH